MTTTLYATMHRIIVCIMIFPAGSYSVFRGFDTEREIPFTVDYMKCQGSENSLKDCVHFKHSYGCVDEESIGVRCQPGKFV